MICLGLWVINKYHNLRPLLENYSAVEIFSSSQQFKTIFIKKVFSLVATTRIKFY